MVKTKAAIATAAILMGCGSDRNGNTEADASPATRESNAISISMREPDAKNSSDDDASIPIGTTSVGRGHISVKLDGKTFVRGSPIRITVEWKGLASGTKTFLRLTRPRSDRFRYSGATNPIIMNNLDGNRMGSSIATSGSGKRTLVWPGRGFDCWEIDYDRGCGNETAEVGKYYISLGVRTTGGGVGLRTRDFHIEGKPGFDDIRFSIFMAVRESMGTTDKGLASYYDHAMPKDISVRRKDDGYCFKVPVEKRYKSPVTLCYPESRLLDKDGVFKAIRPLPGGATDPRITIQPAKNIKSKW